jgi:iron(II)-dependent oxidoreductase
MVLVMAGECIMGSNDHRRDERPVHRIYLDVFYIDKYQVTNARYGTFMQATGHKAPGHWNKKMYNTSNQPVVAVSWHDAEAYCRWAGKRLPTEAEWEKAARGTEGRTYPWGNQWDKTRANIWDGSLGKTTPVGSYEGGKSPYGAYDMAGNGWEWVADWYDRKYYQSSPSRNPMGPARGHAKVLRGGSWYFIAGVARAATRVRNDPESRAGSYGFRCAKTL